MVCAVYKSALSKFRPNPNQQVQLNKLLINQIHKPQTAIKTHLVTHSGFQIAQTMTEDVSAACYSIFQGVRVAWCTPKFCISTEFTYNFSARHSQPWYSGTASGAFVPLCLCPTDVLHVGVLEVYCLSSVSKNPLVHSFYQLPSHFLVSSNT